MPKSVHNQMPHNSPLAARGTYRRAVVKEASPRTNPLDDAALSRTFGANRNVCPSFQAPVSRRRDPQIQLLFDGWMNVTVLGPDAPVALTLRDSATQSDRNAGLRQGQTHTEDGRTIPE